ncbi:MAG: AMP-binding protein [Sphaerochaeta associata]|uniref:AMP-dependent synthetase/ligase n=1 Tax=Sphaerochaeta associata TaxID=1129264 RepID=UPI002B1F26CE|nr:AMP-binding protein [Sphaerochaeta associata]MEA5029765.1 AMP-binding protein [Sphaerochaeta associata]
MERTIVQMLHDAAKKYGDRAYTNTRTDAQWQPSSFKQTDIQSDYIAAYLLSHDFKAEQTVGILSEGKSSWVTCEHGVIKAKMISVPLSIKLTPEEIAFRINHSEAVALAVSANTLGNAVKALPLFDHHVMFIYLDEQDDRLENQIRQAGWKQDVDYVPYQTMLMDGEALLAKKPNLVKDVEATISEQDTINICYTSGTTGNPKGIMLTHVNYWVNSHDAIELFQLPDAQFETLVVLPVDHSFAHTVGIYTSLLRGITLHFVDSRGSNAAIIRNFPKNLVELNPVFLMTVPSITGNFMKKMIQGIHQKGAFVEGIFNRGLEAGMLRNGDGFHKGGTWIRIKTWLPYTLANLLVFPKLRKVFGDRMLYCVGGGALLEAKQQRFFAAIGVPVFQGYGLTEAAPIISSNSPHLYKFGTSGMVAKSEICKIMIDETTEAKVGQRGEIVIKGENVMKGYFKNPAASAEVLRDGWLWTGDLGYYDEDGFLVVTGRAKALLINKDGEKYSPEEVEEVMINSLSVLNQLMVYNDHQMITTALVTLQEDVVTRMIEEKGCKSAEEALDMLVTELRSYEAQAGAIPNMWLPSRFAIIEKPFSEADGLVNSTMKLVRYKTAEFYKDRIATLYESEEANRKANLEVIKQLFFK